MVVYLGAFNEEMSYFLRDKEPTTLHNAYQIAMDIENNLKYSMMKRYMTMSIDYPSTTHVNGVHDNKNDCHHDNTPIVQNHPSLQYIDHSDLQVEHQIFFEKC